ncbi:MAG TPA: hypothetical protein QGH10_09225 [Armatimonadota bacterium]|nr:hypothetical protein [Armatimonadota bacterium]
MARKQRIGILTAVAVVLLVVNALVWKHDLALKRQRDESRAMAEALTRGRPDGTVLLHVAVPPHAFGVYEWAAVAVGALVVFGVVWRSGAHQLLLRTLTLQETKGPEPEDAATDAGDPSGHT